MTPWKQRSANVFLLLDCADEKGVVTVAINKWPQREVIPLYQQTKDDENADIGPHLVQVTRDSQLMQWFLKEGGAEYGIILFSQASAEVLAAHLQPFVECIWPDDRRKMFRFYTPEAFYYFIPSLTPDELRLFLGPACGAACTRPVCTEEGDSLFVEHSIALELYAPPKEGMPWFFSEESFEALEIPSEHSLAIIWANLFNERYHRISRLVGRENIRHLAKEVVIQNRDIRISLRDNIELYMAHVAVLGIGWQQDPLYQRIVQSVASKQHCYEKLMTLTKETNEFKSTVFGERGLLYYSALQRALHISYDRLSIPNFPSEVVSLLASLCPERAEYCGLEALNHIVRHARAMVQNFNLPPRPGIAICSALQFMLGIHCYHDPLQPWIRAVLEKYDTPEKRAYSLFDTAQRLIKNELRFRKKNNQ